MCSAKASVAQGLGIRDQALGENDTALAQMVVRINYDFRNDD